MTKQNPHQYVELTLTSWNDAIALSDKLNDFVFRGHADCKWNLSSTLERDSARFGCPPQDIWDNEKIIISKFKSRAHHFLKQLPDDSELIEWLSIIQDYGGPTRLLDFTDSFYVAAFFASESTSTDACIWAINSYQLLFHSLFRTRDDIGIVNDKSYDVTAKELCKYAEKHIVEKEERDLVLAVVPPRLNDRLAVQKGQFLLPCNLSKSFEYNLCKTMLLPFDSLDSSNATRLTNENDQTSLIANSFIVKIILPISLQKEILIRLYRMNIDAASLFPGLDGFARSLKIFTYYVGKRFFISSSPVD
jgi:hypothetical protein